MQADGGPCDVQLARRGGEAAGPGRRLKRFDPVQIGWAGHEEPQFS